MGLSEALLPYSVEGFLADDEVARILRLIDAYKAAHPERLPAGATGSSVHVSDKLSMDQLVALYEPQGRIEINADELPTEVIEIAEAAFFRHIEDIRRAYPSATWPYGFAYVEYGPGQYFTAHADGLTEAQCAGFGVTLSDDFTGGEFCVETCGSHRFWIVGPDGTPTIAPGADMASEWFRQVPRTQWSMRPRRGVAVFYGSALVHSAKPVAAGALKKLLGFVSRG
jgi:hypothetical protein